MSRPYETPATESHLRRPRCALTVEEQKKIAQDKLAQSTTVPAKSTNGSSETQNSPTVHRRPRWASLTQDNKENSKYSPTKSRSSTAPAAVTEQLSAAPTTSTATTAFTTSTKDSHNPKPHIPPSQLQKQPTTAAVSTAPQPPQQKTTTLASKPHENPPRPRWFPPVQPSTSSPPPPTTTTTQPLQLPCPPRHPCLTTRSSRPPQRTTLIVPRSLGHLRAELATAVINTTSDDDDGVDGADSDASANTTFSRRVRRRARAERDLREEWVDVGEAYGHARRAPVANRSSAADSGGGSDAEGGQWEELDGEKELEVSSFEEEKERRRIKKEARAERRRRRGWRDEGGLEEDEEDDSDDEEGDDETEDWEEVEKEEVRQPESSLSALRVMGQVFKTLSKL